MALKGIKVLEMAGLAPSPLCGLMLKDFGAKVIKVDRVNSAAFSPKDTLSRGKRSIAVDLKSSDGVEIVKKLASSSDVLIDPFRKGVMEKLKIGPDDLNNINPRLIYARMSGYGHDGPYAHKAGHDINYLAMSGVLSFLGKEPQPPNAPVNLLGDFAGGSLACAFAICAALYEREKSGMGQVIDSSMVEGASYLSTFLWRSQNLFLWGNNRGHNVLDGGAAFYNTYKTKDDKYMAVGALEPNFYANLLKGLNLKSENYPQFEMMGEKSIQKFAEIFSSKTQNEWNLIFENIDACVTPVLDKNDVATHAHNNHRNSFSYNKADEIIEPNPAPKLSRTISDDISGERCPEIGEQSKEVLTELGYNEKSIENLSKQKVIVSS